MMIRFLLLSFSLLAFTGCLKTRTDVKDSDQRQVSQQQTTAVQRANAENSSKVSDLEEQIRYLTGRLEVLENKQATGSSNVEAAAKTAQQQAAESNQKNILLQEELTKMEAQIFQLNSDLQALKAERAATAQAAAAAAVTAKKDPYEAAQEHFEKKEWKKAILNYQKYRDENAKGKHYAEATYKIGVCFQELGMREESRTFYDEVISKFGKSEEARKAKTRLKALKKS